MNQSSVKLVRMCDIKFSYAFCGALDSIFFEASGTKDFESAQVQLAFRKRWLGDYLEHRREHGFVALMEDGLPAGYLVGSLQDPATDPLQAEIGYFPLLADLTREYPAHLHVNLAAAHRSLGLGGRLVEAFCVHAAEQGAAGVHVVTGAGMRNVGFYGRLGFEEVRQIIWNGRALVMLGRRL